MDIPANTPSPRWTAASCTTWLKFQQKWVEDLPMVPLYTNEYSDLFTDSLEDYKPRTYFSWGVSILYANLRPEA